MKKIIFFVSLLAIASLTAILPVSAQEATSSVNLGVENPGILPTSPFYFFKEWKRGINKFFTFNPVKKAELELEEANERAAEIKKLEEIAPSNIEAITKAAANYQRNVERLKNRLEELKETSQNPNVDKLLDKLVERSLQHQQLFDGLEKKFEARQEISEQKITELKEKFEANRERMNEIMAKVPEKFDDIDRFKQRMENAVENLPEEVFRELRAIEMLDQVKEKLPEEQQDKIQEVKDRMINKFENRIEKLDKNEQLRIFSSEVLENLPGDQIRRMGIFEEMKQGMRPEIREKIEGASEKILERGIEKGEIRAEEVKKIIQEVKDLIVKIEKETTQRSVKELLEKAKIHLSASEKALIENKIGAAFGQATSAMAVVKNALQQIYREIRPESSEIQKEPIGGKGFKSVYWQCYDGTEQKQIGETSCQPSEVWQKRAKEFCENKCYADGSKCGVNTFKILEECNMGAQRIIFPEGVNTATQTKPTEQKPLPFQDFITSIIKPFQPIFKPTPLPSLNTNQLPSTNYGIPQ